MQNNDTQKIDSFLNPAAIELAPVVVGQMLLDDSISLMLSPVFFLQNLIRIKIAMSKQDQEVIEDVLWSEDALLEFYDVCWSAAQGFGMKESAFTGNKLFIELGEIYDKGWLGNAMEAQLQEEYDSLPSYAKYEAVVNQRAEWRHETSYGYIKKKSQIM